MQEIVSPAQADAIVLGTAIALAGAGIAGGAVAALVVRRRRAPLVVGALVAAAGGLVYVLWMVYNALIVRFGLDSVKALLINLAIFAAVGLVYGLAAAAAWNWAHIQPGGAAR